MTNTTTMEVAKTIQAQLGGERALYMIGARNLMATSENRGGLQFAIMKNARGVTHVQIELADDDTYTVRFLKVAKRTYEIREIASCGMVYADALRTIIEANTGLYLSL